MCGGCERSRKVGDRAGRKAEGDIASGADKHEKGPEARGRAKKDEEDVEESGE